MINWEESERIGRVLRGRRKKLGLNQEDVLDPPVLHVQVVSNIENGKSNIKLEKYVAYCQMVKWTLDDLAHALEEDAKKIQKFPPELALQFKMIETLIDSGDRKEGFKELQKIDLSEWSPYLAMKKYLIGKYYNSKNTPQNWETSKRHLYEAIKLCNESTKMQQINIKSAFYYELGRGYAKRNDLEQAIKCMDDGISFFLPSGARKDIQFTLLLGKAIYLEKLEKNGEAHQVLEELWAVEPKVNTEILLNMIELQANLLNKNQLYKEAITYLNKGIEIARRELNFDRLFELWTTLGSTYKKTGQVHMSKICLKTASNLEEKTKDQSLRGYLYTELGLLYLEEGDVNKAKKYLEKAVKICKTEQDAPRYCESLLALSDLCLYTENKHNSIELASKALLVATEKSLKIQQKDIALKLAKLTEGTSKHSYYVNFFYDLSVKLLDKGEVKVLKAIESIPNAYSTGNPPPG